ncbi:MAG TPA: serine hydrolase [Pyrinomonadaceae bacterium]|jgi:CubicO group peptidase (beta-lactamase class C family)
MKHGKFLLAFAIMFSSIINASGQVKVGAKVNTFKKELFNAAIKNQVEPKVMGYQYVLIKDGKIAAEGAGGKARTGSDGNMDMTPSTPQNVGSLIKFMSGTAMINLFEKPAAKTDSDYKKNGLQANLDRVVWAEFPKVWLGVIPGPYEKGVTQRRITFRHLLQHQSGFDEEWKGPKTDGTFPSQLKNQFNADLFGTRKYANVNFTLASYLLPLLESHNLNYDLDIETNGLSMTEGDKLVRDKLGLRMDALMRERIWNKMSPKFNATCDPKNVVKNTAAYGYPSKQAKGGGEFYSMKETIGHCVAVGGYYTSARDFANYVAHFSQTDLVVTEAGRNAMFNDKTPKDDQLVWSSATYNKWISDNFKMPLVAWSDGAAGGVRTVLLRLPDNYYLVLFATSPEINSGGLFNVGVSAFQEGMKHNF